MATINVKCPGCGKGYDVPQDAVGKKTRCKACKVAFTVEDPEAGSLDFDTTPAKKPDKPKPDKDKPVWWKTLHRRWWFWVILLLVGLNGLTRWTGGSGGKPDNTKVSAEIAKVNIEHGQTKAELIKTQNELAALKMQPKTNPALAAELAKVKEALAIAQDQLTQTKGELTKAKAAAGAKMPEPKFKSDVIKGTWKGTWGPPTMKDMVCGWEIEKTAGTSDKNVVAFGGKFAHPGDGKKIRPTAGLLLGEVNLVTGEVIGILIPQPELSARMMVVKLSLNDGGTVAEGVDIDRQWGTTYMLKKE